MSIENNGYNTMLKGLFEVIMKRVDKTEGKVVIQVQILAKGIKKTYKKSKRCR